MGKFYKLYIDYVDFIEANVKQLHKLNLDSKIAGIKSIAERYDGYIDVNVSTYVDTYDFIPETDITYGSWNGSTIKDVNDVATLSA